MACHVTEENRPEPSEPAEPQERTPSRREEMASSISHAVALLAILAAAPFLLLQAAGRQDPVGVVGSAVFAATMAMVYAASMFHHGLPAGRAKDAFQVIDHGVIFLLIAGTYTPLTLSMLRGRLGWALFGLVWSLAAAGVALKAIRGVRHPRLSICLYLATGWIVLLVIKPVWQRMPFWGFFWVVLGGLTYTAGVAFYRADRIPYCHFVWHLFVIAGGVCHYVAIYCYGG